MITRVMLGLLWVAVPTYAEGASGPPPGMSATLARVGEAAQLARLHPDQAWTHAQSADRQAHRLARQLRNDPELAPEATSLARATRELSEASRRQEPADVRARAIDVQASVRGFATTLESP